MKTFRVRGMLGLHRKYLVAVHYLLIGALGGSSLYFWKLKIDLENELQFSTTTFRSSVQVKTEKNLPTPQVNAEPQTTLKPVAVPPVIEPFEEIEIRRSTDLNRTLKWLDLWGEDGNCTKFDVTLLEEKSVEPRALVSFPGSGNTWLRMLLMGITGVYINSVYGGDDALFESKANSTYPLDVDCGCTLIQKTHDFTLDAMLYHLPYANRTHSLEHFKHKGILIIRNPFKAILAYRNFRFGGMAGMAPKEKFEGPVWDGFIARSAASWELLATTWIRGLKRGGVIYYEKLRLNTADELVRIAKMLGIKNIDQERLKCVLRHNSHNTFKRQGDKPNYSDQPFSFSQRLLVLKAIENVQAVLKEHGLEPLPVHRYPYYSYMHEYGVPDNKTA